MQLVVPDAFAGLRIEADDAVGDRGWRRGAGRRRYRRWELRREYRRMPSSSSPASGPHAPVLPVNLLESSPMPASLPQVSAPGSPCLRNGVEGPQELAGADVVAANVAGRVEPRGQRDTDLQRSPADHDTSRTMMGGDVSADGAGLLCRRDGRGRATDRRWPSLPKVAMGLAGFGVQSHQLIAGRDEQDAIVRRGYRSSS